ncbi:MAG: N-6 DNA methylase [Anaerolineales bacterium]|nr:N-6 DNA methylase [Anaerolineales bacterium]
MSLAISNGFQKFLDGFSTESTRAAFLLHWAKTNEISVKTIRRGYAVQKLLEEGNSADLKPLEGYLKANVGKITLKDLEKAFETLIAPEKRRAYGTVYTPDYIIEYLFRNALKFSQGQHPQYPRICDPSCGSAGFLLKAAEILEKDYGITADRAFQAHLIGIDVDPVALENARCLIELYLASKGVQQANLSLFQLDSLLTEQLELLRLTQTQDGFDVVVTNPPYVKFQNLEPEYRTQLMEKYSQFAMGNFSLSLLFLMRGHALLSSGGTVGMITQNNLFTSLAGKNVRAYLQQTESVRRIVDFGHHKVFENASAYTCLVFLSATKNKTFEYATLSHVQTLDPPSLETLRFASIAFEKLKASKWRLANADHLANLEKIERIGKPLGVAADIKVGFATLKDTVFFVQANGKDCWVKSKNGTLYHIESEITKPAVKVSSLKETADLAHNTLRIIFPYERKNGGYKLISEERLKANYPKTYAYLLAQKDLLAQRDKGKKQYETWYAWARSQGMDAPGPKLLTKTFSRFPQFFWDKSDQLFCNGYAVFPKPPDLFSTTVPIEVLEKILNSKIMHYYAKLTSFEIEGNYQCYQKNFIERFGIPELSSSQKEKLLQLEGDEVNLFLAALYEIDIEEILEIVPQ